MQKKASLTTKSNITHISCVFGKYLDEVAKKPVSDYEKGESGQKITKGLTKI